MDAQHFVDLLRRIGVTQACVNQLIADDLDTIKTLVQQYKGNISSFEMYLKTFNKTMNNGPNPARFSPVIMNRLLAVVHHVIQAVTCFHTMPNMTLIDRQMAGDLMEPYRAHKQFSSDKIDEKVIIVLPELKGHDNWISYRDKFLSNLHNTPRTNETPLLYVVDTTPHAADRINQPYIDVDVIDLDSWEIYNSGMVQFGTHYKKDNSKVW